MWASSTEASGTFICPLILGHLLFAFIIISLWKGYFPSWLRRQVPYKKPKKTNQKTKNPKTKHTSSLGWKSVSVSLIFIQSPESVQRQCRSLWKGHSTALGKFFPKCYHILGVFTSGESSYLQCFEFIHVTIVICYSISEKQSVNEWGENGVCLWVCLALWH